MFCLFFTQPLLSAGSFRSFFGSNSQPEARTLPVGVLASPWAEASPQAAAARQACAPISVLHLGASNLKIDLTSLAGMTIAVPVATGDPLKEFNADMHEKAKMRRPVLKSRLKKELKLDEKRQSDGRRLSFGNLASSALGLGQLIMTESSLRVGICGGAERPKDNSTNRPFRCKAQHASAALMDQSPVLLENLMWFNPRHPLAGMMGVKGSSKREQGARSKGGQVQQMLRVAQGDARCVAAGKPRSQRITPLPDGQGVLLTYAGHHACDASSGAGGALLSVRLLCDAAAEVPVLRTPSIAMKQALDKRTPSSPNPLCGTTIEVATKAACPVARP